MAVRRVPMSALCKKSTKNPAPTPTGRQERKFRPFGASGAQGRQM